MDKEEIDLLIRDFYKVISFNIDNIPEVSDVAILFYGPGVLINNTFLEPLNYNIEEYLGELQAQGEDDFEVTQYQQREIYSKTEIFGNVAHRVSVCEYNYSDRVDGRPPRLVSFIQLVKVNGNWRILSIIWNHENDENFVPSEYVDRDYSL